MTVSLLQTGQKLDAHTITGIDKYGFRFWAIVSPKKHYASCFSRLLNEKSNTFPLEEYCTILESGFGITPPPETLQRYCI
jgi:hypothetical protein